MEHEYKHLTEIRQKTRLMVYTKKRIPAAATLANDAYAFVTRNGGSSYKIFLSEFCAGKSFLMHEMGHMVLQHLRFEETIHRQVLDRVRGIWHILKRQIEQDAAIPDSESIQNFVHLLCNYAMDMEVNSKFFDADEIPFLRFDLTKTIYRKLKLLASSPYASEKMYAVETLRRFSREKAKNPDAYLATPILAEDYGFERGLHWQQYVDLLLSKPDETMQILKKSLEENAVLFFDPNGQGDGNDSHGKIPARVLKRAADLSDMSPEIEKEIRSLEENGDENEDENQNGAGSSHQNGKTKRFEAHKIDSYVRKFIAERAIKEFKDTRTDYLYLSNRGRGDGVVRGKSIAHTDYAPGNVYILVDTSGSILEKNLLKLLSLFSEIRAYIGKGSKVIFWDTDFQSAKSLQKRIDSIPRGGGTNLTPGIAYVGARYCTADDTFFIISDYMDDLEGWLGEIKNLKCPAYGICWKDKKFNEFRNYIKRRLKRDPLEKFCAETETLFVEF